MSATTRPVSFAELVDRAAEERPDARAVVDADERLTWRELQARVARLSAVLRADGLNAGDRVAIQAPSSADFVVVYLASLRAGLVVVPVNPAYTLPELEHILADSGARLLVTSSVAAVAAASDLRERLPELAQVVVSARSGADDVPTIAELLAREATPIEAVTGDDERLAVLLYTSGTSGRPKGAMLSVRSLLANLAQLAQLDPQPLTADDRIFLPLPLFHIFGLNTGLGMSLYFGATLVLVPRFDAAATLATMADEHVTVVVGAPLEFALWSHQPGVAAGFAEVRFALSGSAPLPADLVARYAGLGVGLYEGYGLTEAAPVVTSSLIADPSGAGWLPPKAGSVGRPLPDVEVRLLDGDGEIVEPGDLGTLEVRGANLFSGYWPDASGGPKPDGWFATGDLAVADDDGDYYLVGRRGDLVLVNGFNVYPAEVEAVFEKLAGVREVAVLGEPDGPAGDMVVAYVVPEDGFVLDPDALLEQASAGLARFKLPRRIIEVTELPHTATGKVMKWRLRAAGTGLPVTAGDL